MRLLKVSILSTILALSLSADGKKVDGDGLIITDGYEKVKMHCTVCHSGKFISKQRGDRNTWLEMIRWMQKTQKLWDLGDDEKIVLDYLENNYKPSGIERRKSISPALMPPKS